MIVCSAWCLPELMHMQISSNHLTSPFHTEMHHGRRDRSEDIRKGGMMEGVFLFFFNFQPTCWMHCWMTGSVQWAQYQTKVPAYSAFLIRCVDKNHSSVPVFSNMMHLVSFGLVVVIWIKMNGKKTVVCVPLSLSNVGQQVSSPCAFWIISWFNCDLLESIHPLGRAEECLNNFFFFFF